MPAPLEIPVINFPTPNATDRILVEVKSREEAAHLDLQPGTPHPNVRDYSGFVFVRQVAIDNDDKHVRRIWVNERSCQDVYNASRSFSAESNSHPIFTRSYLARRDSYSPLTKGIALSGVVGVQVTAGGSAYAVAPTISFTGGAGSGAAATAIVFRGALVAIVMTSEGAGYTSAPTVVITPHSSGGTGATATAIVQPSTAVLVKEDAARIDDPALDPLWVRVDRVYETLPGPELSGQDYDPRLSITVGYTEQITAAGEALGEPLTEIEPLSSVKQRVKVWDAPTEQLDAYHLEFPGIAASLNLPDVLQSVAITYNSAVGDGDYSETANGAATGDSASLSLSLRGRSQGSAATMPDLQVDIEQVWSVNVPTEHHVFYMPDDDLSITAIKAKINALLGLSGGDVVQEWPVFKPVAHTITLQGQRASLSADASVQQSVHLSTSTAANTWSSGSGYSSDFDVTIRTVRIPPTIHGAITFTVGAGDASVDAEAASVVSLVGGTNWPARSGGAAVTPITANSTVTPSSLSATDGVSAIPTSVRRIKDVNIQPFQWGYSMVHVELVNFAIFA